MVKIDYRKIAEKNEDEWKALTREPQKYEALLAGHYSDSNHFVYELLQNAEDAYAENVVIEYYSDKLAFYHDGKPFDEADVKGVSSMLSGTKDKNDASTIGRFGMGFKSVFKYTHEPIIYSDNEAFKICNYLLPKEVDEIWNFKFIRQSIKCILRGQRSFYPFSNSRHLTKIVVPFVKKNDKGELSVVSGIDVINKLKSLNGEILLFLSSVKSLYWVDKTNNTFSWIRLNKSKNDDYLVSCTIEGSSIEKPQTNNYLLFTKLFDHHEMKNANVSIAYRMNALAKNINPYTTNNKISVYFPTKDETSVPFLMHGSFETAVSREKLMEPSQFNNDLFDAMVDLIVESINVLKERNLITQSFIRTVLIPAFFESRLVRLKEAITDLFKAESLIPTFDGSLVNASDVYIPVPFKIADFSNAELFFDVLQGRKFAHITDEKGPGFAEYFKWLKNDVGIDTYTLTSFAYGLDVLSNKRILESDLEWTELIQFYSFLQDYNEEAYLKGSNISSSRTTYARAGEYESLIRQFISTAWYKLRRSPIVLNGNSILSKAFEGEEEKIYYSSKSEYKTIDKSAVVLPALAEKYKLLFLSCFDMQYFDNFQFVKEKVITKYVLGDSINFETDDCDNEYIEDISQVLKLLTSGVELIKIKELLKDAYIIRVLNADGETLYSIPSEACPYISEKGIDLKTYFAEVNDKVEFIDEAFYVANNISLDELKKLGVYSAVCSDGERQREEKYGDHWWAQGKYCPHFKVEYWDANVKYIEEHKESDLAKKKSAIMLKLLLENFEKLKGQIKRRKNNSVFNEEESQFLTILKRHNRWLYDKNGDVKRTVDISRLDLDERVYGKNSADKRAYETLGFIHTERDISFETIEAVNKLSDNDQIALLKKLAQNYGFTLNAIEGDEDVSDGYFNLDEYVSDEFPVRNVKNIEKLRTHVREQFFCADPVKYEKVWRQIRTSRNANSSRSYVIGMYTNSDDSIICQMCCTPKLESYVEAIELGNYGIEMEQLNLCLCKDCAVNYKSLRDSGKEQFKKNVKTKIMSFNISEDDEYILNFENDMELHFTATHIAEIKELFLLIDEYGVPGKQNSTDVFYNSLNNVAESVNEKSNSDIANIQNRSVSQKETERIRLGDRVDVVDVQTNQKKTFLVDLKYRSSAKFLNRYLSEIIEVAGKKYKVIKIHRIGE